MTEPESREERALREAFAAHADAFEPADLAVPTRPVRRRRRWIVAAAAAVLVLGAGSGIVAARSHHGVAPAPVAQAADGWWATWHDVTVEVPGDWAWGEPPAQPECIHPGQAYGGATHVPGQGYVAIDTTHEAIAGVGCAAVRSDVPAAFGRLPFEYWQPYVAFADPHAATGTQPDGTWTYRGWMLTRHTVGDVQLAVLARPGEDPAAILDTARVLGLDEEDAAGCPPSDPVQGVRFARPPASPRRPAGTTSMTSVSICQYDRTAGERAGLMGSRRLTGSAATRLLAAIDAAPRGGGPDQPQDCLHSDYGQTAILLRVHDDTDDHQDAYVYYGWCFGNGVFTPDGAKRLTTADCRPLFAAPPIMLWEGQQPVFERCSGD